MPGSTTSVFSDPDGYASVLQIVGTTDLLITGHGAFRAQLTHVALVHAQLAAATESVPRIAFVSQPSHLMAISLPTKGSAALYWGETSVRANEIITSAPGHRMYERTEGPSRWRTIWLPAQNLVNYGRAMNDARFDVPPGACRWRPTREALSSLSHLHDDAIHVSKAQPYVVAGREATRGLEQELIEALVKCMRTRTIDASSAVSLRHADIMRRFEDVVRAYTDRTPTIPELSGALNVPDRTLRTCCQSHLGMGPHRYLRLRRMQLVRRALQEADTSDTQISKIALQHGFSELGRFSADYNRQFGELPSATMRRRASQ